jgi:hypothetical protein
MIDAGKVMAWNGTLSLARNCTCRTEASEDHHRSTSRPVDEHHSVVAAM